MLKGSVRSFLKDKGFGFIKRDDQGPDMFFHSSSLVGGELEKLVGGARVTFEVGLKRGKEQASRVTLLPAKPPVQKQTPLLIKKDKAPIQNLSALEEFEKEWGLRPTN